MTSDYLKRRGWTRIGDEAGGLWWHPTHGQLDTADAVATERATAAQEERAVWSRAAAARLGWGVLDSGGPPLMSEEEAAASADQFLVLYRERWGSSL